ncbi:MAG TPA: non-ribosomal peptide synthetase [Micromonosporaceae bacterium]|nr:non-ribosomal peptide synthetase [Micromonosporaceae bacterium]
MVELRLDEGLTARLGELGRRCRVRPRTVVLAGLALLLRRYTGHTVAVLRPECGAIRVHTARDAPVRAFLARVETAPAALDDAGGGVSVGLCLDGPQWSIELPDCPVEPAEPFTTDLVAMLDALTADPEQSTVDLLPASAYERRRPIELGRLHGGPVAYAPGATIPETFAAQVARYPDRPAVLADDACLTYRELGSTVAVTAARIRESTGPGPGRVAVLCRHGAGTVTALLGALSAGRAYVPLDPGFPQRRQAQLLAGSAAQAVLVDREHAATARRLCSLAGLPDLPVVEIAAADSTVDIEAVAGVAQPDDPAYVLYTSGSTGTPKGVVQSHRNVLFGIANHVRNFAITPADRVSVLASFGYDMAVTDLFGAILSGAAAVPVDVRTLGLGHLAQALAQRRVTVYHSTPTVYRYLLASLGEGGRLPDIRAVLLGGEEVTRHDVDLARRHFAAHTVFVNGYGTTEISFATQCHLPPDAQLDHAVVPIGSPVDGVDVVLVDDAGRPTCLTGEILVRTPHVALGYLHRPELSAGRFIEHRGVRAYRTGDLARRLPDGRFAFLGRADRLVKIRGHRVELGEIEAQLAALPGVAQAAVVSRPRTGLEQDIIGYVVPARDPADPAALRAALAASLPDFMVPRVLVPIEALPVGPTGKLDATALPPPPLPSTVENAGADPLERAIGAVWCDILGIAEVDRHATFFELGGHSLLLALVQQRLEPMLGQRLPLARLVEYPTVASLAAHLRAGTPNGTALTRAADRMRRRRSAMDGRVP